jgi:hypothetical protein
MLDNFKEIIESSIKERQLVGVTHAGIFHSDDLACSALLHLYCERIGIEFKLVRIYEETKIPVGNNVIVYDMGNGVLDHSKEEEKVDGRNLSSLGKLWRFGKEEFKKEFGISERLWNRIDKDLICPIDKTDTASKMNPLTYWLNSLRCVCTGDQWEICFNQFLEIWKPILKASKVMTEESAELKKAPILTINGKRFRFTDKWISGFDDRVDGHIWKDEDGTYKIRMFKDGELRMKGIKNGENTNIIYINTSGRNGQVKSLDDLRTII